MSIYQKITDLIGGTPLLELVNIEKNTTLTLRSLLSLSISILPAALRTELLRL